MDPELYVSRTFEEAVETELTAPTPLYQKRVLPKENNIKEDTIGKITPKIPKVFGAIKKEIKTNAEEKEEIPKKKVRWSF